MISHALSDTAFKTLIQRRRALLRKVPTLEEEELAHREAEANDWVDRAVNAESEGLVRTLAQGERNELAEIDAALERLASGRYGWCESCGAAITARRLAAVPEARTCYSCRSQQERGAH